MGGRILGGDNMANLTSFGVNSLRSIKEDGSQINMADIHDIKIRSGSLIGRVTVTALATALRVGTANLTSRHSLIIINDASDLLHIGLSSSVTTVDGFLLNSGTGMTLHFDPNDPVTVWGLTTENQTNISVWELK
jgi:hypothetical protein